MFNVTVIHKRINLGNRLMDNNDEKGTQCVEREKQTSRSAVRFITKHADTSLYKMCRVMDCAVGCPEFLSFAHLPHSSLHGMGDKWHILSNKSNSVAV